MKVGDCGGYEKKVEEHRKIGFLATLWQGGWEVVAGEQPWVVVGGEGEGCVMLDV